MSTKTKASPPPPSPDLEETAELPQLSASGDPLSATDAWMSPGHATDSASTQTLPALSSQRLRGLRAEQEPEPVPTSQHEAEIGALRSDLASVSQSRSQLERDLGSLGGNLRELEQMLNRKSEELSVYEREVGLRDRRIAELETRAANLDSALAERQVRHEIELGSRQAKFDSELMALSTMRSELQEQLGKARAQGEALQARAQAQATELTALQTERGQLQQRYQHAEQDLSQWRSRGERYRETLQHQEGRRQLYDGMIAERDERIGSLERESSERAHTSGVREQELRGALHTQAERVRELEAAKSALETVRRDLEAAGAAARERMVSLEDENRAREQAQRVHQGQAEKAARESKAQAEQALSKHQEQAEKAAHESKAQSEQLLREHSAQAQAREQELSAALSAQQQRNAELETARRELEAAGAAARAQAEAEAAAARVRIAALEADGQKQAESVRDLKVQLGAVRDSLAQRNALIERVEAEAASSVAMLGNIQHNLEHLGAEDLPHLLTRTDGATGIVHLLGRRTTIGRTPDNDVHIDAEFISRHHAVALRAGTKTVIEDLNSTNGTYVNGQRVSRRTLKDGDLVALGTTEFRFSIKAPA